MIEYTIHVYNQQKMLGGAALCARASFRLGMDSAYVQTAMYLSSI